MNKVIYLAAFVGAVLLTLVSAVYQADVTIGIDGQDVAQGLPFSWITASRSVFWGVPWHVSLQPIGLLGNIFVYALVIIVLISLHTIHRGEIWTFDDHHELRTFMLIAAVVTISLLMYESALAFFVGSLDSIIIRSSIVVGILTISWVTLKRSEEYAKKI